MWRYYATWAVILLILISSVVYLVNAPFVEEHFEVSRDDQGNETYTLWKTEIKDGSVVNDVEYVYFDDAGDGTVDAFVTRRADTKEIIVRYDSVTGGSQWEYESSGFEYFRWKADQLGLRPWAE